MVVISFVAIVAVIEKTPLPMIAESTVLKILLAQAFLWTLLAMLVPNGVGGLIWGVGIVGADGRRASRLRLAWREAINWVPLFLVDLIFDAVPLDGRFAWFREFGTFIYATIAPIVYVGHALVWRGRYLNDRLAGTAVVPA